MIPTNDIERLLENPKFGEHDYPELFRLMRESELIFLVSNPNNQRGVLPWADLTELPQFVVWGNLRTGQHIPLFSSHEAARRACREIGAWNTFAFRQLKGQHLFEMLSRQSVSFALNPVCSQYQMIFDRSHAKQLADGTILDGGADHHEEGTMALLDPHKYPEHMVSELLRFFKKTPAVRAAWLLHDTTSKTKGKEVCYVYVLEISGNPQQVDTDFQYIAHRTCPENAEWGLKVIDPADPNDLQIAKTFPPFYVVDGYQVPADKLYKWIGEE